MELLSIQNQTDFKLKQMTIPTIAISLDLREEELADEAVEAGLQGSFLRRRVLSIPFSLGDGIGVPRGEAGSWWGGIKKT